MKQHLLGKWYLRSVVEFSNQLENFIPFENLKSMYISLEDDGTFSAYDSQNNHYGSFTSKYEIVGNIYEKGTLLMNFINKTDFIKWCETTEEEISISRSFDIIKELYSDEIDFQHLVTDDTLQIFTDKYLIICQRKRIFDVDFPKANTGYSLLSSWLG